MMLHAGCEEKQGPYIIPMSGHSVMTHLVQTERADEEPVVVTRHFEQAACDQLIQRTRPPSSSSPVYFPFRSLRGWLVLCPLVGPFVITST